MLLDELEAMANTSRPSSPAHVLTTPDRFWVGIVIESFSLIWWGERGTSGQTVVESHDNQHEANENIRKSASAKLHNGFDHAFFGQVHLDRTAITILAGSIRNNERADNRELIPTEDVRDAICRANDGADPTL